jgi:hypothetical protein
MFKKHGRPNGPFEIEPSKFNPNKPSIAIWLTPSQMPLILEEIEPTKFNPNTRQLPYG